MAKSKVDAYNLILMGLRGSGIEYGNYMVEDLKFQSTENLDVYLWRNNPEEQHTGFLFNDKILHQFQKTTNITFYYQVEDGNRIKVNCNDTSCDSINRINPCYYRDFIHFYSYGPDFYGKIYLSEYPDLRPEELDIFNSLSVSLENYYCSGWIKSLDEYKRRNLTMYLIREHQEDIKNKWGYEFRFYLHATRVGTRLYLGNSPEQSKLGIGFSLPWFYYKNIKENETKRLDLLCSIS